ncbi:hypothetical protein DE146DRAFT_104203 [Phaeosphaeria sp. MPI-PUGE-AT-0046c]|nr:hypothetical protein DE146DRAFT_104203 [Phaeosphaeria sp. MPI-PUGE-AT-0046c]
MISSTLVALVGLAVLTSATCDRAVLEKLATNYVRAQATGDLGLLSLATNATYIENEVPTNITKGLLSQPITIDLSRSLLDTTQCSTFTEITAATNKHQYVVDTRMLVSGESITSIQSVIADSGDWVFNATSHLQWSKIENWDPIPQNKQDARAVIQAAGDAYLDSWADGKIKAPYGTPCARLEGGIYTGDKNSTANTCFMPEFPKPFVGALNRRYVIDEVLGGMGILNNFPFIDTTRPDGTPSTNMFRVEGGKIRYIHETTVCATKGCGR